MDLYLDTTIGQFTSFDKFGSIQNIRVTASVYYMELQYSQVASIFYHIDRQILLFIFYFLLLLSTYLHVGYSFYSLV